MNNYDYPIGADNESAPWNEKDKKPIKQHVVISLTMSIETDIEMDKYTIDENGNIDYTFKDLENAAREQLDIPSDSKEFKDTYEDRITDSTGLEESKKTDIALDNAFNLDFDAINAFGECLTEAKQQVCCLCGEPLEGYGNNPEPFMSAEEGSC